ncbi:MAG: mesaconyl-CoA isomerase [Hydrocarboniphaga sp.]|uniref:CoA transferase n=1 Tax=Hydrocarboniphaga sp. TaxID=2033016 RepID=UPI00260FA6BB|nr:CoA transferase [Hydrocarboniphaga sp.]MDB5969678.1 mesaconyl-CoA isomerase [Hydrocarboniphaga sp.]
MNNGILSGLRVVEASAFVAAPLGGMTLAQMGADVIRIDSPGGGLDYRRWPVTDDDTSLFWCGLNKAKRSVCIDFGKPEGRELAMALITAPGDNAGMLLTNFPPRGWLSYEALCQKRPDLIQLTIQGDRHGGSAVDYTINPAMGLPYLTGPGDSNGVVNHVLPAWDLITGQMAAVGLLAAERHRRCSGQGQHVKLALQDVALAAMGNLGFIAEAQLGHQRERVGNYLYGAFGRDFVCSDGERVMVVGLTSKQWKSLIEATETRAGIDMLAKTLGLDLGQEGNRFRARESIAELLSPWIAARPYTVVAATFDRHGVCWSRYQTVAELISGDAACSEDNPMFRKVEQHGVGSLLAPTIPLDFSKGGRCRPSVAPRLGENTDEVLSDVLGLDSAAIGKLHEKGLVSGL